MDNPPETEILIFSNKLRAPSTLRFEACIRCAAAQLRRPGVLLVLVGNVGSSETICDAGLV